MHHANILFCIMVDTKKQVKRGTKREYDVQKNEGVKHQDVAIYFTKNQFPPFQFFGTHNKPRGVLILSNRSHVCFNAKPGHYTFSILCIPCVCTQ